MKKMLQIFIVLFFVTVLPVIAQTVQVGDDAPQFTGITVYGNDFSLQETVKDSIIVIYFMGYS